MRGETAEVIVAAAEAMRAAMTAVDHGLPVVVDTCGTGGDGSHTLNLSTAAAVVVAACGLAVAKHGNRSVSSRCGSADVVEALGVPVDVPAERQHEVLREAGIAFLFAPAHHPALRHAAQARRELGDAHHLQRARTAREPGARDATSSSACTRRRCDPWRRARSGGSAAGARGSCAARTASTR